MSRPNTPVSPVGNRQPPQFFLKELQEEQLRQLGKQCVYPKSDALNQFMQVLQQERISTDQKNMAFSNSLPFIGLFQGIQRVINGYLTELDALDDEQVLMDFDGKYTELVTSINDLKRQSLLSIGGLSIECLALEEMYTLKSKEANAWCRLISTFWSTKPVQMPKPQLMINVSLPEPEAESMLSRKSAAPASEPVSPEEEAWAEDEFNRIVGQPS